MDAGVRAMHGAIAEGEGVKKFSPTLTLYPSRGY